MLFVFPDHLIRIQKDFNGSPEMDAMLHEVDPVLFLIPFKGSFRQIYIKYKLSVPLYIEMMRFAIQFVLQIAMITKTPANNGSRIRTGDAVKTAIHLFPRTEI